MMNIVAAANAGVPAIVTALGGVGVSLTTVYFNSKKQAREAEQNAVNTRILSDQVTLLASQVGELKVENAGLKTELRIIRGKMND